MSGNFKGRICVVPSHQLKFFVYSAERSTNSKQRSHRASSGRLQEVENIGKL